MNDEMTEQTHRKLGLGGLGSAGGTSAPSKPVYFRVEQRQMNKKRGLGCAAGSRSRHSSSGISVGEQPTRGKVLREESCGSLFLPTDNICTQFQGRLCQPFKLEAIGSLIELCLCQRHFSEAKSPHTAMLKQHIYNICQSLK